MRLPLILALILAMSLVFILSLIINYAFGYLNLSFKFEEDFRIGFIASLWENWMFFLTIGMLFTVYQIKYFSNASFMDKMKHIFGETEEYTISLHENVSSKFTDLLSYFYNINIKLYILDIDGDYIKFLISRRMIVGNLSKDVHSTHALEIFLSPQGSRGRAIIYLT